MNTYSHSSIPLLNSINLWLTAKQSDSHHHYKKGISLIESIDHRVAELGQRLFVECSGLGDAFIDLGLKKQISDEISGLESIRKEVENNLRLNIGIVAAFDIYCPDHNGSIRSDVLGGLENEEIVIATKSLVAGMGSTKGEVLRLLHKKIKAVEDRYHYWVDEESQYVLMIPKKFEPELSQNQLLKSLDFTASKWVPIDAFSLIETSSKRASLDTFFSLFNDEPKVGKRWIACGHGGASSVCGMDIEDYDRFYRFLEGQKTDFLYVTSCKSGIHKKLHLSQESFPVVLGTYSGEDFYSVKINKDFFNQLNSVLSSGMPKSVRPFEKIFRKNIPFKYNESIIYLPNSRFPFQLLFKNRSSKDLVGIDIARAKCFKQPIDLTKKEKVCIHPSKLDAEIVLGKKTIIFPYEMEDTVTIDHVRLEGCTAEEYFAFLSSEYKNLGSQKGGFLLRRIEEKHNILWTLSNKKSVQWQLPSVKLSDASQIRELVGKDFFNDAVLPLLSAECHNHLALFDSVIAKGGIDLTSEEENLFKSNRKICLEQIFTQKKINPTLFEQMMKYRRTRRYLLSCCIRYEKMDMIPDLTIFQKSIQTRHFQEVIKKGNIALLDRFQEICPDKMPAELNDWILYVVEGGEEMMIALYHRLKLTPDIACYDFGSLFDVAIDMGWMALAEIMIEEGKPKGKSMLVKDDPLNVLIDACQKNIAWKPLVIKAIQQGWDPLEENIYGHSDLPINRLIRLGQFELFLTLMDKYSSDELARFCQYLPLSAAIDQTDIRYMEILLSVTNKSVNAQISPGVPLICKAVKQGNYQAVELLIRYRAHVQLPDPYLEQPISLALKSGDLKMIEILIEPSFVELSKEDYPHLIELIKKSKDNQSALWKLLFLAYKKPSLYEPDLSKELVSFFYNNGMRAQAQWIVGRKDKHQQYNAGFYLEMFAGAEDLEMVRDFLKFHGPIENKAAIALVVKKLALAGIGDEEIVRLLEQELNRFV